MSVSYKSNKGIRLTQLSKQYFVPPTGQKVCVGGGVKKNFAHSARKIVPPPTLKTVAPPLRVHERHKAKQSIAKMCNGRRHVPLCPICLSSVCLSSQTTDRQTTDTTAVPLAEHNIVTFGDKCTVFLRYAVY